MNAEISHEEPAQETVTEMTQPIIVDLGKQKSSRLKKLKRGEGPLWEEVHDVMAEVKNMLGEDADGKILVPVVMVYEKKTRRRRIQKMLFPLA